MSVSIQEFNQRFCEESLDEMNFLYELRRKAIYLSEFTLFDFVRLDKRILGHLRGKSRDVTARDLHLQLERLFNLEEPPTEA